jgi:hypothetical protein
VPCSRRCLSFTTFIHGVHPFRRIFTCRASILFCREYTPLHSRRLHYVPPRLANSLRTPIIHIKSFDTAITMPAGLPGFPRDPVSNQPIGLAQAFLAPANKRSSYSSHSSRSMSSQHNRTPQEQQSADNASSSRADSDSTFSYPSYLEKPSSDKQSEPKR